MRQRAYLAVAAIVLAALATPRGQQKPPAPEQKPPTFRVEANFVRVDAFPTKDGQPVQELTAEDFELFEDGAPQKIASFEHVVIAGGAPAGARVEPNSVREAERMAANPRNRVFVIFLDIPHVQVSSSHAIKEPLIQLLQQLMSVDDLVAVMTPLMAPTEMTFGRKTEVIEQQLRDNWPWGMREVLTPMDQREMDYEICYPPSAGDKDARSALAKELIERRRERMVLEALNDMLGYLGGIREERKAIILVTEGWRLYQPQGKIMEPTSADRGELPGTDRIGIGTDGRLRRNPRSTSTDNTSSKYECDTDRMTLAAMDNQRYFRDLLDVANRANASFYPVDPRGLPVFDDSIGPGKPLTPTASINRLQYKLETLRTLAENTDGLAVLNNNNLNASMRKISDDLSSYYLLGYYSTNTKLDGTFRNLKVRVKTPGVDVRARRGYRAATAAEVSGARGGAAAPVSDTATAVADAVSELARIRPDLPFVIRAMPATTAGAKDMAAVWIAGELQAPKDVAAAGGTATIEVTGGGLTTKATADLKPGERAFLVASGGQRGRGRRVRARADPAGSPVRDPSDAGDDGRRQGHGGRLGRGRAPGAA